jgi:hypothetical protein
MQQSRARRGGVPARPAGETTAMGIRRLTGWSVLAALIAFAPASSAQQTTPADAKKPEVKPDVRFDHLDGKSRIYDLDLNHGQKFIVRIENTCPDAFDYSHSGLPRGATREQAELALKALEPKDLPIVYDEQYGGYVIHIQKKDGVEPGKVCTGGEKLETTSFIVSIRQQQWNISFSGAFTFSGLTDPVFSLKTENNVKKVFEEPDKQDSVKLGAASFVHLFHDGVKFKQLQPALGFGLGINSDSRAEYMVGAALRFGDKATINFGRAWGSIARLPNGTTFDTPVTDDNVLNNLGRRNVSRWFFAISYAFIDTRDRLLKPFAPETAAPPGETKMPEQSGEPDPASVKAIVDAAKNAASYAGATGLEVPATAQAVCDATAAKKDAKSVDVTVKVKASDDQLKTLNADATKKAAATKVGVAAEKAFPKLSVSIASVTFAACP